MSTLQVHLKILGDKIYAQQPIDGVSLEAHTIVKDSRFELLSDTIEVLSTLLRTGRMTREEEVKLLGSALYAVLLENKIGDALHRVLNDGSKSLVRVVLDFSESELQIAAWPWEYLYRPGSLGPGGSYFLSRFTRLVLVRHVAANNRVPEFRVIDEPVRVLLVASSPDELDTVVYEPVLEMLQQLREEDRIELRELLPTRADPDGPPGATYRNFQATLNTFEPHVVHFVGHGSFSNGHGRLAFMSDGPNPGWIVDEEFANDLFDYGNALRCVFLQSCESAMGNSDNNYHAVSGVAMHVAGKAIPAVVGMQYRVRQGIANAFAKATYQSLAEGEDFEMAVQKGREAVRMEELERGDPRASFALPVLYLRDPGTPLFAGATGAPADPGPSARALARDVRGDAAAQTTVVGSHSGTAPAVSLKGAPAPLHPRPRDQPQLYAEVAERPHACAWCGEPSEPEERFCTCGRPVRCSQCGTPVTKQRSNCGSCGAPLSVP